MSDNIDYKYISELIFEDAKAQRRNPKEASLAEKTLVHVVGNKYASARGESTIITKWLAHTLQVKERTIFKFRSEPRPAGGKRFRKSSLDASTLDAMLEVCTENPRESNRTVRAILREKHDITIKKETFRKFRASTFLKRVLK
jgi:hypothetical protein